MGGFDVDFRQVETKLMELDRKSRSATIHNALTKGAKIVEKEIKSELLNQKHFDTGSLYESIKVTKLSIRGTSSSIRVGIDPTAFNSQSPRKVTIYGYILQYGTRRKAGTYWMTKAKNNSYSESKQRIAIEIKKALGL